MKTKTTVASKNLTKKAALPKVQPAKPRASKLKVQEFIAPQPQPLLVQPELSFEDDVLRILHENPGWKDEIGRLPMSEVVTMGVRDTLSSCDHLVMAPLLLPRKKEMTDAERVSLNEMRMRRAEIIARLHTLVDSRLKRGFVCQDADWLDLVKNMVVVAVVGAEGMRGPFEFKSWMIGVARTEGILDMEFVRRKNISTMDFKLMIAICLYAFVMACRNVHLSVRDSDVIPSMNRGNLEYAMRVLFGTFWTSEGKKRDTDVLTLAAMMVASTMTEMALAHLPHFLTTIAIPQTEWPWFVLQNHFPIVLYQHVSVVVAAQESSSNA
jgi:hypothetical protein